MSHLPDSAAARKLLPAATGFVDYFPDALIAVAGLSRIGNEQHNPGKPLHWDRSKSGDESDALMRHFIDRGTIDTDGVRHSTKVAWRALAMLQKEIEAARDQERPVVTGLTPAVSEGDAAPAPGGEVGVLEPGDEVFRAGKRFLVHTDGTFSSLDEEVAVTNTEPRTGRIHRAGPPTPRVETQHSQAEANFDLCRCTSCRIRRANAADAQAERVRAFIDPALNF